jgi:hypothetical protein
VGYVVLDESFNYCKVGSALHKNQPFTAPAITP